MSLKGRKIIVGVTGSIAAYKTPALVRLLVKAGAQVKVLLTASAATLVSPLALSTVSKNEVLYNISDKDEWNQHVELGLWADAFLIAPCTANTLAKMAQGICDTLIGAVYLSARCPVFVAPAMDLDMWAHPATQRNIKTLKQDKVNLLPVGNGELASGLVGAGRMLEPEEIFEILNQYFSDNEILKGQKALVTAGPTYEKIDPVRFIGNFSSGKMGIEIADALAAAGAEVKLVLGPSHLLPKNKTIQVVKVESADEMYTACTENFNEMNIAVLSAAVADFKPTKTATDKIKKNNATLKIELEENKDILFSLGQSKTPMQTLVGFALETENELSNAQSKLERKNADLIVLNSLKDEGAGFAVETNKVTFISKENQPESLPLLTKAEVAKAIVNKIIELRHA